MTQLFKDMRLYGYIAILLLSAVVLGISAYLASIFLPNIQHDFGIFSLIVSSLTILLFLTLLSPSKPWMEALVLFILGVLWLAMGAWTADIMGNVQCDALGGNTISTKTGSTISAKSWCYEMKVIEAFSWMLFVLFAIFFWILITLTARSKALGRAYAWTEPIAELPWFGQFPGWEDATYSPNQYPQQFSPYPGMGYPMSPGAPYPNGAHYSNGAPAGPTGPQVVNGGYVISQQPGHSVVIQPGARGQVPTVTQVPGVVTSA